METEQVQGAAEAGVEPPAVVDPTAGANADAAESTAHVEADGDTAGTTAEATAEAEAEAESVRAQAAEADAEAQLEAELAAEAAEDAADAELEANEAGPVEAPPDEVAEGDAAGADAEADAAAEAVAAAATAPKPTGPIAIGVDVGGSGIKAAAVDLHTGEMISERHRVLTPQPATPAAIVATIARLVKRVAAEAKAGPDVAVGVGFPAVVIDGVTKSAANVDPGWIDFDADTALRRALHRPVHLVNDADAAGVAEMRFGVGVGEMGTVFLITLGTGTGSALFYDGMLVPNLELGHMEIRGRDAERRSAAAARVRRGLSWKAWASDLDEHLVAIEKLFSPRLFIIGGGVSKRSERYMPRLTVKARVVPAKLLNDAGIVGAAMAAAEREAAAGH